jgi:hypothetical protein
VPLSLFLRHPASLTEQADTHLKSLTFGIRQEYAAAAEFWRNTLDPGAIAAGASVARTDLKTPFPIPAGLAPRNWKRDPVYDLVIVSDLSLMGGTRRCNEGYIEAAAELGLRVGLFHWPRYDLVTAPVAADYRRLSGQAGVDILVPQDAVEADTILIHHPPILKYRIDAVPRIAARQLAILVNQLPMQRRSMEPHYYFPDQVAALTDELFGLEPLWLPISPLCRRILREAGGYTRIAGTDWIPPLGHALDPAGPPARTMRPEGRLVLGRHARDHATKWPDTAEDLRAAYCADMAGIEVRLMGGTRTVRKKLGKLPSNFRDIPFDAEPVDAFLDGLDVFVHYVSDDYIEEFGRNVMEAMAAGVPAILPPVFRETFGEAALYATPSGVARTIDRLRADPGLHRAQVAAGYAWVLAHSDRRAIMNRLGGFVQRRTAERSVVQA